MSDKEFKTVEQQIMILEQRGLHIPDRTVAADFLHRNNYYRVSGYSLTLRSHDQFSPVHRFRILLIFTNVIITFGTFS